MIRGDNQGESSQAVTWERTARFRGKKGSGEAPKKRKEATDGVRLSALHDYLMNGHESLDGTLEVFIFKGYSKGLQKNKNKPLSDITN